MPPAKPPATVADLRRLARNHHVFLRIIGRPFLRALVLPYFALLLLIAMADANTDWAGLRDSIGAAAPVWRAGLLTALALGWSLVAGRALRPIWRQPVIAFLARQPLGGRHWLVYLLPSICVGLVPLVGIAWLTPRAAFWPAHYAGLVGLGLPIVLAASAPGRGSLALLSAGTLALCALIWLYAYWPVAPYAALAFAVGGSKLAVRLIRRQVAVAHGSCYSALSGSGVIMTIVRRDLRYLARRQSRSLVALALLGGLCAAMMLAFRINGEQQAREALLSATVLLSVAASPLYEMLESLKAGLGREIMRRRWPVSCGRRSLALLALIAVLSGPSAALILVCGSTMGLYNTAVYVLFAAVVVTACAALFGSLLLARRSANGLFLLGLTGHAVLVLALPAWTYVVLSVASIAAAFGLSVRGFDRFRTLAERTAIEQLA